LGDGTPFGYFTFVVLYLPFILFFFYGQKLQMMMVTNEVGRALGKLKIMKDKSRKEAVDYFAPTAKSGTDPSQKIDQFLDYFTIMPVDLDPNGIIPKIDHLMNTRDDRLRQEIKSIAQTEDTVKITTMENVVEVATALNFIYKIVRHFYLMGKKTSSIYVLIQLQMIMPLILQEADALMSAIDSLKNAQPLGDGIGPMVTGRMMLGKEKMKVAKDTLMSESEYSGRPLYLIKAEGPGGTVGQPGAALEHLIESMSVRPKAIIMIDAALKLEGEKTGEIAEGIGAAIGGIGVDRFKIEQVASKHAVPLYAVVIKQSILDAITVMKKEISEAAEKVANTVNRIIEEKSAIGDKIVIVGVGNTLGVGQ
jgi:hypothetical protein